MNKLGETKLMNCGMKATIIRFNSNSDLDVEFEDGTIITNRIYSDFDRGMISPNKYILINGHRIRANTLDKMKSANPNLDFDFSTFNGKTIYATCISNSHREEYNYKVLCQKNKQPHRRGGGCKICSGNIVKTNDQFDIELHDKNPYLIRVSEYTSTFSSITIKCLKCNKEFTTTPHNILTHPTCHYESPHQLTDEEFKIRLKNVKPHLTPLGKYSNAKTDILIRCDFHPKKPFLKKPDSLLRGKGLGCEECNNAKLREDRILSETEFVKRAEAINPDIDIISPYTGTKKKIAVRYRQCGHVATLYASNLLHGYGCGTCANIKYSLSEFKKIIKKKSPNIEIIGPYLNSKTRINAHCTTCGNNWSPIPDQLIRGHNCPNCSKRNTSTNQEYLTILLETILGSDKVLSRDFSAINKELDIYIPSLKIAFEPGSWFYHKNRLKKDKIKKSLCRQNGIRLITIYFDCNLPRKANQGDNDTFYINDSLNSIKAKKTFFEWVLNDKCNIPVELSYDEHDAIYNSALRRAFTNREKIRKDFNASNHCFKMIGDYHGASEPALFECRKCGSTKSVIFYNMKNRKYCWNPSCDIGRTPRYYYSPSDPEEFLKMYVDSRTDIIRLNTPTPSNKNHILVHCLNCDSSWNAPRQSLIDGRRHRCHYKKTTETFILDMKNINPKIEIRGEYINAQTHIEYGYVGDMNTYSATPDSLLHGHHAAGKTRRKNNKDS